MALNVVPLLFVALPFVLAMDAMYDLVQDFTLPSDRRGWGLTDDNAKANRVRRAYLNHFNAILTRQRNAFAAWKADGVSQKWREGDKKARNEAQNALDKAKKSGKTPAEINTLEDALAVYDSELRNKYGVGVTEFEATPVVDLNPNVDGALFQLLENLSPVDRAANASEKWFSFQTGQAEAAARTIQKGARRALAANPISGGSTNSRMGKADPGSKMLEEVSKYSWEKKSFNEINRELNRLKLDDIDGDKWDVKNIFRSDVIVRANAYRDALLELREGKSGAHSGVFKWVIYNQQPADGAHNMFSWNYPTLLVAGILLNMLGEYYAGFSPMVGGQQAKDLCNLVDQVLLVHMVIVGVQFLVSLYYNFNSLKNRNARNPSLDLMDIHNHPEDFVSALLIGVFNHLGTAVLIHTFVRAALGHSLRKSRSPMGGSSRRSRRSRRSSRRRRR